MKMKKMMVLCVALLSMMTVRAEDWLLVTNPTTLEAGDEIVLANVEAGVTASLNLKMMSNSIYLETVSSTFNENVLTSMGANTAIFTLGGDASGWTLTNQNGRVLGTPASKKLAWDNGTTTWIITKDSIQSTNPNYGAIQYNKSYLRFTTYTKQTPIQIFKKGKIVMVTLTYWNGEEDKPYPFVRTSCTLPQYMAGTEVQLSTNVPINGNMIFAGWEFDSQIYQPGETIVIPDKDVVLEAKWQYPEAIDEMSVRVQARKLLREGMLVIVKDDVMFNVLGERIQ